MNATLSIMDRVLMVFEVLKRWEVLTTIAGFVLLWLLLASIAAPRDKAPRVPRAPVIRLSAAAAKAATAAKAAKAAKVAKSEDDEVPEPADDRPKRRKVIEDEDEDEANVVE